MSLFSDLNNYSEVQDESEKGENIRKNREKVLGFLCDSNGKESACDAGVPGSIPGSRKNPWRRE